MKKIIIALDFSNATKPVLEYGVALAEQLNAEILLVHVIDYKIDREDIGRFANEDDSFMGKWQKMRDRGIEIAIAKLNELAESVESSVSVSQKILQGVAAHRINLEVEEQDADLLIVGSHGHGLFTTLFIGSVAERLVRIAKKPVLVIPINGAKEEEEFGVLPKPSK